MDLSTIRAAAPSCHRARAPWRCGFRSRVRDVTTTQHTRRRALQLLGAGGAAWIAGGSAQGSELPIKTSGLEHIGMQVPDQDAAAKFYGRIFDPQLFQERDPPPRFYVKIGISYIAFGALLANVTAPKIDHFCAVVLDYKAQEMRKS